MNQAPRSTSPRNAQRRQVLKGFAGAVTLAGVGSTAWAQAGKEAPALAKLVSDGKLPALAQRLPSAPLVIQAEKVGTYGGALRRGLRGSADHNGILRMVGNQGYGPMASSPAVKVRAPLSHAGPTRIYPASCLWSHCPMCDGALSSASSSKAVRQHLPQKWPTKPTWR